MKVGFAIALLAIAMLCVTAMAQENTAEGWYKKGNELLNKGAWKEVIEACDKALQIDPTYAKAWSDKAVAFDMLGEHEEAIRAFDRSIQECDKVLQANPNDVDALVNKGNALKFRTNTMLRVDSIKQDRPKYLEQAVKAYDKALEIDPRNTEALMQKGSILDLLGRHEEALGSYDKAIEANPRDAESWLLKGNALSQIGKYEEALSCYNKVLEIDPKNTYVSESKGLALVGLGRQKEAAKSYNKALEPYDTAIKTANSTQDLSEAWIQKGFILQRTR